MNTSEKTGVITSWSENTYDGTISEIFDKFDVSIVSISASEIATKIRSRQCKEDVFLNNTSTPFSVDDPMFCKLFNQQTIDSTLAQIPEPYLSRYKQYALQFTVGDDMFSSSGPGFLTDHVKFTNNDSSNTVVIQSPSLKTEREYWQNHFHIPRPSGIPDPGC